MQLLFLLAKFLVFLFLAVDFRQQLERAGLVRPELQNILQSLAGIWIGVIVDVLTSHGDTIVDLAFAAAVFRSCS